MSISVTDPIEKAITRTKEILFRPFDAGKWFKLGFCAFLAALAEGGGNPGFNGGGGWRGNWPGGPGRMPTTEDAFDWIHTNIAAIVSIGLLILIVLVGLWALLGWLSARGRFMFVDGIVKNRGAVVEPWHEHRQLANSFFVFSFILALGGFAAFVLTTILGTALAWPDITAGTFGDAAWSAVIWAGGLLVLMWVALGLVTLLLTHFVMPTMYVRQVRVMDAWSIVRHEVLAGHVGTIVLYFLMKLVLGIAITALALVATCATCCIAGLPYIGTVVLLPLIVFQRCYTLYFLEQFGDDWRFFPAEDEPVECCANCGYDLRGGVSNFCPECGSPTPPGFVHPPPSWPTDGVPQAGPDDGFS